jgi:hypothetical protein
VKVVLVNVQRLEVGHPHLHVILFERFFFEGIGHYYMLGAILLKEKKIDCNNDCRSYDY